MFLFNYYFSEFELEVGRTIELDILQRTSVLSIDAESDTSGSSVSLDTSRRTSVLVIGEDETSSGRSASAEISTRRSIVIIETY